MTYPVTFEAEYVERRSRVTVFLRLLLAIPLFIWAYVYGIVTMIAAIIAWVAIVVTGRYPAGLYDFVAGFTAFATRLTAYTYLLTDAYPPFVGIAPEYPVRMTFHRLDSYNRLKTLFRFILAIPIMILRYIVALLMEVGAVAAWFVIIVLGRMPRGLFNLMEMAQSYTARSDAYLFLLTETYPPFEDDRSRSVEYGLASS